ncbi:Putative DNA-binding domain-containing protein [Micromonospora viridifaciens]|uniref:Putative DNA-binding domain-containing protein n=1 Tax=Micromonospora viridifaciens TaxID=1881 RepID=A0A1C4Z912_MICVI|nr:ATP-binding protein [Micromonospora viridifaciens]SCF29408.1 Putative DNA-binding domain-containing protein [Micromonospora viridifaciens]
MVALRSRRLESVFGVQLDSLAFHHIHALVAAGVQESFDLDFKLTLYGRSDADKRSLASDVAALANTGGGVILLGIEEDDQARATNAPGVEISDAEVARMRQVIASLVAPMPALDILSVPDKAAGVGEAGAEQGFIVVAVPRSPGAPHAVLVNDGLRFPMRNGATTRYLSEPEVATAYRNRFASVQRQAERMEQIEQDAIGNLAVGDRDQPWIVVSLVPALPGDMTFSRETFEAFQQDYMGRQVTLSSHGPSIHRTRVGRRRLLADGTSSYDPEARWISLELHGDGAGAFSQVAFDLNERRRREVPSTTDEEQRFQIISDEWMAAGVVAGLLELARHARDRTAAGGEALIRAQLYPVSSERPTTIGHARGYGFPESRTEEHYRTRAEPAEAAASLDDLAQPSPQLVQAAALLLDELGQAFGVPEMGQLSRDGRVRRPYWGSSTLRGEIVVWAEKNGIEIIDE